MINKNTEKLFSVACIAGNFGATIYNRLFGLTGVNAVYLPLQIHRRIDFSRIFESLNLINTKGVNVSMPFKIAAKKHAYNAPNYQNINTLVKEDGIWAGYNTDSHGFITALETMVNVRDVQSAWIFGAGAVATTIKDTLHKHNPQCSVKTLKEFPDRKVDLVVNASPIGMDGVRAYSPWNEFVEKADYVFDAVVARPGTKTDLIRLAEAENKSVVSGHLMSMHGLIRQYCLHFPQFTEQDVAHLVKQEVKEMGYEI